MKKNLTSYFPGYKITPIFLLLNALYARK